MSADLRGERLGHYLIAEVLGRGGMSVVYRATDLRLDRPVALKVMSENLSTDQEFRARFAEEARAASAIDHVNVVPLYDFGEEHGWLYIAMRLVAGTDLAREINAGPLPPRRALSLLGQVGAALDVLHEHGLVHLDVKPANVLITRDELTGSEHVYLADFGLTRRGAGGHRTADGNFLGSPSYASPEHLRGRPILPSADIYSLTCVLFAALAGRAPYVGDIREVITGQLSDQVPSLAAIAGLDPAIDRVIARGMASEPTARYGSSLELLAAARRAVTAPDRAAAEGTGPTRSEQPAAGSATTRSAPPDGADTPTTPGVVGSTPTVDPVALRAALGRTVPAGRFGPGPLGRYEPEPPGVAGPSVHHTGSHRLPPDRSRFWWWIAAGAGLIAAVAVVVIVLVNRGSGEQPPSAPPASTPTAASTTSPSVSATTGPVASPTRTSGSVTPSGRPGSPPVSTSGLLLPSQIDRTEVTTVSGLPDPFATSH